MLTFSDDTQESVFTDIKNRLASKLSDTPLVSIVVIAYNEEKHLLRSISSLSDQDCDFPYEVIVVDNNSKDRTLEIAQRCGTIALTEKKQGVGFARQAGLDIARGTYHLCADADTVYPPEYIRNFVSGLSRDGVSAVFGLVNFLPERELPRYKLALYEWFKHLAIKLRAINRPELCCGGASFAFKTKQAQSIGWRTDIARGEDGSMAMSLKQFGNVRLIDRPGTHIWTSARTLKADGSFIQIIAKRIQREFARLPEYLTVKKGEYKTKEYNRLNHQ